MKLFAKIRAALTRKPARKPPTRPGMPHGGRGEVDPLRSIERYVLEASMDREQPMQLVKPDVLEHVKARYEAAQWSANRTYLPGELQNAHQDINSFARREVARRMRWFEKNNGAAQKILDLIDCNTVGTGLTPSPRCADLLLRDIILAHYREWAEVCDISGTSSAAELQSIEARAVASDGEIFVRLHPGSRGRGPRIQHFETHRVEGSVQVPEILKGRYNADGKFVNSETGEPVGYAVTVDERKSSIIPADEILHIYDPARANQYRGVSLFHAALNDLHDLDDLQTYTMIASKDAAGIAHIIKTKTGQAPDSLIGDDLGPPQPAPTSTDEKAKFYKKQIGGQSIILENGDEWDQADNIRPSESERAFWQALERKVCRAVGVSYAAFTDYEGGWGGATLRAAVIHDNRFYRRRAAVLIKAWVKIYRWWLKQQESTILADYRLATNNASATLPADWMHVVFQSPRNTTVDIGYEANATTQQLRSAQTTLEIVCGQFGGDWREYLKQRADEEAYKDKLAKERNLSPERIMSLDSGERAAAAKVHTEGNSE